MDRIGGILPDASVHGIYMKSEQKEDLCNAIEKRIPKYSQLKKQYDLLRTSHVKVSAADAVRESPEYGIRSDKVAADARSALKPGESVQVDLRKRMAPPSPEIPVIPSTSKARPSERVSRPLIIPSVRSEVTKSAVHDSDSEESVESLDRGSGGVVLPPGSFLMVTQRGSRKRFRTQLSDGSYVRVRSLEQTKSLDLLRRLAEDGFESLFDEVGKVVKEHELQKAHSGINDASDVAPRRTDADASSADRLGAFEQNEDEMDDDRQSTTTVSRQSQEGDTKTTSSDTASEYAPSEASKEGESVGESGRRFKQPSAKAHLGRRGRRF